MSSVHIYGDHVDTDVIIPARYLNTSDPDELKQYCMIDIDDSFTARVQKNDIIVAGYNFGCGSSREHAPIAIKASGVKCIIAKSFARIFFRNAFNIGLPVIESKEIVEMIETGDKIEIDFINGMCTNVTKNTNIDIPVLPTFMLDMIEAGGLVQYTKSHRI